MNPEIKTKWLTALRSGDYNQGQTLLRSTKDEYCCLGVLCDLAPPEVCRWEDPQESDLEFSGYTSTSPRPTPSGMTSLGSSRTTLFSSRVNPPDAVLEWAGEIGAKAVSDLVLMNDREGASFDEIADWIEENL